MNESLVEKQVDAFPMDVLVGPGFTCAAAVSGGPSHAVGPGDLSQGLAEAAHRAYSEAEPPLALDSPNPSSSRLEIKLTWEVLIMDTGNEIGTEGWEIGGFCLYGLLLQK